jgi:hypothetical protein
MMMSSLTIFTVIFAISCSVIIADDPCRFEVPGKGVIDLSTLGLIDGRAAYPDKLPSGSTYSMLILFFVLLFII